MKHGTALQAIKFVVSGNLPGSSRVFLADWLEGFPAGCSSAQFVDAFDKFIVVNPDVKPDANLG